MIPRQRLLGVLAALALVATGFAPAHAGTLALAPGDPSPPMVAWGLDGSLLKIEWQGLTLLNFWATWCEACRVEMPELQKLVDTYGEQRFRVFGLSRESVTVEQVAEYLEGIDVRYPLLKPDEILAKGWVGVNVLPTSYLIDAEGKILRKYVGATREQIEGMREDIDNVLNGRPMGKMVIVKPETTQTKRY